MRRSNYPRCRRGGFTLVELLVVMTIIAIMVAMISSAVMSAFARGTDVKVRNEITQLANGVQAFQTKFAVQFVPDRLVFPPGYDNTGATQLFLKSVWPRLSAATLGTGTAPFTLNGQAYAQGVFSYWQVTGTTAQTLQGDQVLVWMLGGWREISPPLPATTGVTIAVYGFNTDPTDPMKPYTAGQQRSGPFFEGFTAERLQRFDATGRATGFPSFVDDYGGKVPYMYFSSGKAGNDYTGTAHVVPTMVNGSVTTKQMLPFKISTYKYANPQGFQIISAGRDNAFGDGDIKWAGAANGVLTLEVKDDMANFYQSRLGD